MKTLTVFTPTYNRAHTLHRVYESLCKQSSKDFTWLIIDDGSTDNTLDLVNTWKEEKLITISYIKKENEGLYSGYNTAVLNIETELCVCIDSDDFMPSNAVEIILKCWKENGNEKFAGICGLDFYLNDEPIGGYFPNWLTEGHLADLTLKKIHLGDRKEVIRTELLKKFAPMEGFPGEKNFNPYYLIMQVDDIYKFLFLNENLCYVEYQENDSMSKNIYSQYLNSPRSFAKYRIMEMKMRRNTIKNRLRLAIHYNSSTIFAKDRDWFRNNPFKLMILLTRPLGYILCYYIKYKVKKDHILLARKNYVSP